MPNVPAGTPAELARVSRPWPIPSSVPVLTYDSRQTICQWHPTDMCGALAFGEAIVTRLVDTITITCDFSAGRILQQYCPPIMRPRADLRSDFGPTFMHTVPSASHLFSRLFGRRLATFWSRQSLAGRFTIASLAVLGCGMTLLGAWVSSRIEEGVLYNSASSAALYINTFIDPQVQELAKGPNLRPETVAKLDELLNAAPLRRKVVGIKI